MAFKHVHCTQKSREELQDIVSPQQHSTEQSKYNPTNFFLKSTKSIPSLGLGYGLFALPALASIAGIAILYKKEQDKEEKLVKADTESIRQIQKLSSLSVFPACLLPHPFLLILSPIPATMNYFTSKALFERTDSTFLHLSF